MNDRASAMLEEYKSLRQESIEAMRSRNALLALGAAAVGVLFLAATNAFAGENVTLLQIRLSFLLFLVAIPGLSGLLFFLWLGEADRMSRAGAYMDRLEDEINEEIAAAKPALAWEGWLRENNRQMTYPYVAVVGLFFGAAAFSMLIAFGFFVFPSGEAELPGWLAVVSAVVGAAALISAAGGGYAVVRTLR